MYSQRKVRKYTGNRPYFCIQVASSTPSPYRIVDVQMFPEAAIQHNDIWGIVGRLPPTHKRLRDSRSCPSAQQLESTVLPAFSDARIAGYFLFHPPGLHRIDGFQRISAAQSILDTVYVPYSICILLHSVQNVTLPFAERVQSVSRWTGAVTSGAFITLVVAEIEALYTC